MKYKRRIKLSTKVAIQVSREKKFGKKKRIKEFKSIACLRIKY